MNKKKLVRKMALPAAIIFMASIAVLLSQFPYRNWQHHKRVQRFNDHIARLTDENQRYLEETAKKIEALLEQANRGNLAHTREVREIQSQVLLGHQKLNRVKRYLWMSNNAGEFIFGAPAFVFEKLNSAFDKYRDLLTKDDLFKNRNDFLVKVVDRHDEIDFSKITAENLQASSYLAYQEDYMYVRPRTLILSTPVSNQAGVVEGTLFLKVDNAIDSELYYTRVYAERRDIYKNFLGPIFGILAFFSGLFLWFLLPTWVYIDAQQRDVSNPGVWAFITLISLIFGLAIYLITRPSTMKSLHCPKCENALNGAGAFCPYCGFDRSSTYCPQCQYPIKTEWSFCPNCRAEIARLKKPEAALEKFEQSELPSTKENSG
ncbi:MAG: zinc ribbon domain-containing protein [candidate division KSB1 bacterium]|nr:zinc ribbon domain-containing protein [candidate division KSB1 bacterium]